LRAIAARALSQIDIDALAAAPGVGGALPRTTVGLAGGAGAAAGATAPLRHFSVRSLCQLAMVWGCWAS
jgi:hypothetical protein